MGYISNIIPRWEKYKHFFQITIFRYLVLWFTIVPILAKLLEGLTRPLDFYINNKHIVMQLELPFNWQILWLSSFFFIIALIIYYLRCPRFIKTYNKYSDYQTYSHDPRWLAWEARGLVKNEKLVRKFVERLSEKKLLNTYDNSFDITKYKEPQVGESQTTLYFQSDGRKYGLAVPVLDSNRNIINGSEQGIFWEIFGRYSGSRGFSRFVIALLLIFSAISFAYVFYQHISEGFHLVYNWVITSK